MTIVGFVSVKGAPGVTTLASLVGATWPAQRRVVVVEGDPSGGDLAARFQLSSGDGWPSFIATVRRAGASVSIESHLQQLPGGLDVLVGTRGLESDEAMRSIHALLSCVDASPDGARDLLVDLGRFIPGGSTGWVEHADSVVICARSDAASLVQVREKAPTISERCRGRVWLVIVGSGSYSRPEIEQFTGLSLIGVCPFDQAAATVAAGQRSGGRRLRRSPLVAATASIASILVWDSSGSGDRTPDGAPEPDLDATARRLWSRALHRANGLWSISRPNPRLRPSPTGQPPPEKAVP
jgi:Flp pilus assembly CpaE family ATPase